MTLAGMRILLVEDNPGDARLMREFLRESAPERFDLILVDRAARARETLRTDSFDVVLLDLSLPDSTGIETVERVLPGAPETPIIVLTGLDDASLALRAVQAGAQDYLIKDEIDGRLLIRAIGYARERKRLDIERLRALEREQEARSAAEAAVRARDEVMGIVSHDLGNSLSAVRLNCTLLERAATIDQAEIVKRTRTIRTLVDQMHRLRQDLIDIVSLQAGRLAIEIEELSLGEIAHGAVELLGGLAAQERICLREEFPPLFPRVNADPQRILQVLSNLIGNAIKFTPAGGEIRFRVAPREGEVQLSVSDTGPGIDPEHAARVFDPFWRAGGPNDGGAGLGLAIARGIVTAHGGRIWLEGGADGGSAFHFLLPTTPS